MASKLLADDGDFGGRHFQAVEFVVGVEKEVDLQIGRGDLEKFVGFAVSGRRAR